MLRTPERPRAVSPEHPFLSTSTPKPSAGAGAPAPAPAPQTSSPAPGPRPPRAASYAPQDISRALLIFISNNIGQLAYLNALQHRCADVYFAGNFLRRENTVAMRTLAYSIRFWSKGTMDGLFLRHEGYCGALGAFLMTLETSVDGGGASGSGGDGEGRPGAA